MFARMDKISKQKTIYLVENNIYIENSPSFTPSFTHGQEATSSSYNAYR